MGASLAPEIQDEKLLSFIAYEALPSWLGALFLVSLLCLIMSTVDTILFIAAQCFATDISHVLGKKKDRPRKSMRISIAVVILAVLGLSLLTQDIAALFWLVVALWAALTPLFYMLLPVKKPSDWSMVFTMVILAFIIITLHIFQMYQDYYVAYIFFLGMGLPLVLNKTICKNKSA